jgi:hypothetical protein
MLIILFNLIAWSRWARNINFHRIFFDVTFDNIHVYTIKHFQNGGECVRHEITLNTSRLRYGNVSSPVQQISYNFYLKNAFYSQ